MTQDEIKELEAKLEQAKSEAEDKAKKEWEAFKLKREIYVWPITDEKLDDYEKGDADSKYFYVEGRYTNWDEMKALSERLSKEAPRACLFSKADHRTGSIRMRMDSDGFMCSIGGGTTHLAYRKREVRDRLRKFLKENPEGGLFQC